MKDKKITGGRAKDSISLRQAKKSRLLSFVVLMLCAVILGCALIMPKYAFAEGEVTPNKVQIDELTLDGYDSSEADGKVFNGANLRKLYAAILGDDKASYKDLKERLYENGQPKTETLQGFGTDLEPNNVEIPVGITSEDLRSENYGGNEITVYFGGIEWEVVYITTASGQRNGHVIVDLWQKDGTEKSSFSAGAKSSYQQDTAADNPSHLYSTSFIRSQTLNAGNDYYEFEGRYGDLIEVQGQSVQNVYSKFTMANDALSETEAAGKSLVKYIAKPSELKYQEVESWLGVVGQDVNGENSHGSSSYCMPNEAYGTPWKEYYYSGANFINTGYGGNGANLKADYGDWSDDYIWLPSLSELFKDNNNGIWGLSDEQRATEKIIWLRTGVCNHAGEAYYLDRYSPVNKPTNSEYFVRPALHLDLTEAEQAAQMPEPKSLTASFDGSAVVYTCTQKSELKKWITVSLVYDTGEEVETENYEIEDFTLVAGDNTIIVVYLPERKFSAEINISGVQEAELTDLIAEFDSTAEYELYPDSDINCLKPYITVRAKWNYKEDYDTIDAENYSLKLTGKLTAETEAVISVVFAGEEQLLDPKPLVKKGTYDMDGVELVGETQVVYDGNPHGLEIVGNLPDGVKLVSITYALGSSVKTADKPVNAGTYTVIAKFKGDEQNFNKIFDITASLTISQKIYSLPQIESKQYTGEVLDFTPKFVADNLGAVRLSVDGAEDINCFKKVEAGDYTVTVEIISNNIIFEGGKTKADIKFSITKQVLNLPEYTGKLCYTGNRILPTGQDFENFKSELMVISEKSQYGREAGNYIAVIALKDSHNYAWRTDAAARSAENVSESEVQIKWSVERAVISATRTSDKMPFIVSESYRGSFDNVIGYRYYADAECKQGVLLADLKEGERYFVCADLIDTDNFVLDEDTAEIFAEPFSYIVHTENSDLLSAIEKLNKANEAIFISGACILGFAVLLTVALLTVAGFVIFKKMHKSRRKTKQDD